MATGGFITSALACSTTKIALGVASTDWEGPACPRGNKSISAHTSPRQSPLPVKKWKSMQRSCSVEVLADQHDRSVKTLSLRRSGRFQSHKVVRRMQSHQPQHMYGSDGELRDNYAHKQKESLFDFLKTHKNKSYRSPLHHPKNSEALIALLRHHDANAKDEFGEAPIHSIVKHKRGKRLDVLLALLIYSDVIVNLPAANGNTALHLAVMEGDELLIKVLLSFGAKVNSLNHLDLTPVDIALQSNQDKLIYLLVSAGGTSGDIATNYFQLPRLMSFQDSIKYPELNENEEDSDDVDMPDGAVESNYKANGPHQFKLIDFEDGKTPYSLYEHLQHYVNNRLELSGSFSASTDEAFAITVQQRELLKYKKTQKEQREFKVKGGSRILCLDGGGIKGLVEIEVLMQLEEATGRRITELFDWIVGTSTGGILALGLVYGKKSLRELQQLYFKIKEYVFANDRAGFAYNTEALEKLIKEEFGTDMVMQDVLFPRVLVSAVSKKTTQPELRFFNNCFGDEFTLQPVWKAARATSAAPMFFKEFENYVDGGVLANNPCEYALTAIQNHYRGKHDKLDIALVVSVGSGIYPEEELGKIDAQEFLFFGKHWFKMKDSLKKRAQNLITLLMTALLESESIAENCRSRLIEQGIPFYRFNPHLDDVIPAGETDTEKLLNMILKARTETIGQQMDELVQMFHLIAEMTRKLKARKKCEAKMARFSA